MLGKYFSIVFSQIFFSKILIEIKDSKLVVRSIESHGMRALARQVTRQRGPYKIERPEIEQDRKYTKQKCSIGRRPSRQFMAGAGPFTEALSCMGRWHARKQSDYHKGLSGRTWRCHQSQIYM